MRFPVFSGPVAAATGGRVVVIATLPDGSRRQTSRPAVWFTGSR